MSVKYKVHLPDHDFATAVKQKLTPTAKCVTVDILIYCAPKNNYFQGCAP